MYKLLVIQGYSGAGKDYLVSKLVESGFEKVVGYTTRPMRAGEVQGKEYHFVSEEEYLKLEAEEPFLASRTSELQGKPIYYGIHRKAIDFSKRQVIILDNIGTYSALESIGRRFCKVVRLYCDSEELIKRATDRGDRPEDISERIEKDKQEFSEVLQYAYSELNTTQSTDKWVPYILEKF